MFLKLLISSSFVSCLLAQDLQPPQALTVVSATSKQVQLRWTAGDAAATGYTVERKPFGGDYSAIVAIVTNTNATDNNFDPYTAYVYRVRATAPQVSPSGPSNEVTVGPAPYGYNTVVQTPSNIMPDEYSWFGAQVRMILDNSGDPAFAYVWTDEEQTRNATHSGLYFVRWDRAHYRWTKPLRIASVGETDLYTLQPVSLAQDASNGMFGIAYQDQSNPDIPRLSIALSSDGGTSWPLQTVAVDTGDQFFGFFRPSLAMGAGNIYLSYYHDYDGIRYRTGRETDNPAAWSSMLALLPGGFTHYDRHSHLALDVNGKPAIVYLASADDGSSGIVFWRPDSGPVVAAMDRGNEDDIRLAFSGTQPRILYSGAMDDLFFADYDHALWLLSSPDNGATWSQAVNIKSDQGTDLNGPMDLAFGSRGQAAAVTETNGGNGTQTCSSPKLSLSPDLAAWTTCGVSTIRVPFMAGYSPSVGFAGNDTLYIGFQQVDSTDGALPLGITLWRQPPDWSFPPPPPSE